jgi:hypothetical protein
MTTCSSQECISKFAEYKYGIDKLLMRLRESEQEKSEHVITNITLKQQLNQPSKSESKSFIKLFNHIESLIDNHLSKKIKLFSF